MLKINAKIDSLSNSSNFILWGGIIHKYVKKYQFDFFETDSILNHKKVYGFNQNIINRYNTNHEVSEWCYLGKNQNILFNEKYNNLEFISLGNYPNIYIWTKKSLHKNKKEAIFINMDTHILQNKSLKMGLIDKKVISDINNYEQYKILQFVNDNDAFCLDNYNETFVQKEFIDECSDDESTIGGTLCDDDILEYELQEDINKFYFMNNGGIEFHYNSNGCWHSVELEFLLNDDCYYFFEISGQDNKVILKDIYLNDYLESGVNCDFYDSE